MKKQKSQKQWTEEWDMREGMGILPDDIPLTQNIGCVGGKPKKSNTEKGRFLPLIPELTFSFLELLSLPLLKDTK